MLEVKNTDKMILSLGRIIFKNTFVLFLKNQDMIIFFSINFQKTQFCPNIFFVIWEKALRSFWGIWGYMGSNFGHRQKRTNYTLKWSSWNKLFKKGIFKVKKIDNGQKSREKSQKSQISELMKCTQITDQNKALSVSRAEKLVFRSKRSKKLERSERLKGSYSTNYLERSERLKGSSSTN